MKLQDLSQQVFGRLTAIEIVGRKKTKVQWLCRCSCGASAVVGAAELTNNATRSCGCLRKDVLKARATHGATVGGYTPEYSTWNGMITRCINPKAISYKYYGARGITVCERWRRFENFFADMGKRPSSEHSLERIDNNKGYSPENCKWATEAEQHRNFRTNRMLTFNGKSMCLVDWAKHLGMPKGRLNDRINKLGWSIEQAFTTPRLKSRFEVQSPSQQRAALAQHPGTEGEKRCRE